jgi:glucan phosphoethanolaminetransferase (alkaline phosphatase superfamily)
MSPRSRPERPSNEGSLTRELGLVRAKYIGNKRMIRARRSVGRALLFLPPVAIVAADLARRWEHIAHFARRAAVFYLLSALASAALWSALIVVAASRRGMLRVVAFAVLAAIALFALGAQSYTFARYAAYMDHQAVLVGTSMLPSIGQQLWSDRVGFAQALLPPVLVALALPFVARTLAPSRPRASRIALDVAVIAFALSLFVSPAHGGEQGQPPDVLYISAMGQLARARWDHNESVERVHPGPRSPIAVPQIDARPPVRRNVVMVLTESVRSTSTCVAYDPNCEWTPFSNAAAPNRIPLRQMRALDSTTAISLAILWSGLAPEEPREALHSAPLLWEYAHAAQWDTAYWTSQNLLFGNSGAWVENLPFTRSVSATQIEADATMEIGADDGKLIDRALDDLAHLHEPFVAVVHLSNTHFPYKVDPAMSPFLPEEEATGPGYEVEIKNRYQDAIYLQDKAVGRFLDTLRARPEGARTVVMFLSDHGEQMREKGAVGHTGTLFEEEIRIPAWIDAPPGTLTEAEETNLRKLSDADAPVTSLDVLPTMLDLTGMWDDPKIAAMRARMPGESLLRGGSSPERAIFLTNCSELWQCAFKNWGAMRGTKKLIASQGDHAWNCFDVASDPFELHELGTPACGDLVELAEKHGRPF